MNSIVLTWLGHACFKLLKDDYSIVIDPYTGVMGYSEFETTANEVVCSHGHGDHSFTEAVHIIEADVKSPFKITEIETFHDDESGAKRGINIIRLFETVDGLRIAHFGDLGHMPDNKALDKLKSCDAIMIPVGGYFTIDSQTAKAIIDIIKPRIVIPMHYRYGTLGFPVLAELNEFLELCSDVVQYTKNSIEINSETKPQTAVLKYLEQ